MSGTINVKGKNYSIEGLTKDAVGIAKMLAEKTRLHDEEAAVRDLSEEEDKEIQTQVRLPAIIGICAEIRVSTDPRPTHPPRFHHSG